MKRIFTIILVLFIGQLFSQSYIKSSVLVEINQNNTELIPIIVKLESQVDLQSIKKELLQKGVNLEERRSTIVKALYTANSKTNSLDELIESFKDEYPDQIRKVNKFWAVNAVSCQASPYLIEKIRANNEVKYIQSDFPVKGEKVTKNLSSGGKSSTAVGQAEAGLIAVHARGLWALGYTGRNRLAMNIDTGVMLEHPTLNERFLGNYRPLSQAWLGFESDFPVDANQGSYHGTHTMGTMIGLDTETADTIGLAFNSFWIASDPIVSDIADVRPLSDYFIAFEWALNPDEDLNTSDDIPDVINNSWGVDHQYWTDTWQADCDPIEYDFIEALEMVDCAIIFSNGNEGPDPTTTGMPAGLAMDTLNMFSVGALNGHNPNYPIADFSSKGPSICNLVDRVGIKPEVSAPGVNVRSASGTDSYQELSGTSMAGPHVSGAVLLLREAFPNVTSNEIKNALYQSAIDLGDVGEDNTYGNGLIDVYEAYLFLAQTYTPTPPISNQYDLSIDTILNASIMTCEATSSFDVVIKNEGTDALSDFVFRLVLNGDTIIESILNITLQGSETYAIPVSIDFNEILNNITVEIEKSGIEELNIYNNFDIFQIKRISPNTLPYYDGFENIDNTDFSNSNYYVINPDKSNTWILDTTSGISNSSKSLRMEFVNYLPRAGQLDYFQTGSFDIPSTGNTYMYFKHAYAQRYSSKRDSLFIVVSNTCDITSVDTIFKKGGAILKTRPNNASGSYSPQDSTEWADNEINLSAYAGQTIFIQFIAKNEGSNNLFIDEFKIENGLNLSINKMNGQGINVFPNPTEGDVYFNNIAEGTVICVYSINGSKRVETSIENGKISLSNLPNGIYFIKDNLNFVAKIVLSR